MSCKGEVFGYH